MECRAEFLAVVRLDLLDLERQFREDVIDEFRSRPSDRCADGRTGPVTAFRHAVISLAWVLLPSRHHKTGLQ